MIKNILVALDGSEHASAAIDYGLNLVTALKGQLTGIHVRNQWLLRGSFLHDVNGILGIEPQMHMAEEMERYLTTRGEAIKTGFVNQCEDAGLRGNFIMTTGGVADEIESEAARHDLLLLGVRGVNGPDGEGQAMGGGHLPAHLLKSISIPMLVCPLNPKPLKKVVVAFDASAGSFRALATAAEVVNQLGLELQLLFVDTGGLEYEEDQAQALAERYLSPYDLNHTFIGLKGTPQSALKTYMASQSGAILALGSHGSSRLKELILGRLPERIIADGLNYGLLICP